LVDEVGDVGVFTIGQDDDAGSVRGRVIAGFRELADGLFNATVASFLGKHKIIISEETTLTLR
jgi:hypothetical protein